MDQRTFNSDVTIKGDLVVEGTTSIGVGADDYLPFAPTLTSFSPATISLTAHFGGVKKISPTWAEAFGVITFQVPSGALNTMFFEFTLPAEWTEFSPTNEAHICIMGTDTVVVQPAANYINYNAYMGTNTFSIGLITAGGSTIISGRLHYLLKFKTIHA